MCNNEVQTTVEEKGLRTVGESLTVVGQSLQCMSGFVVAKFNIKLERRMIMQNWKKKFTVHRSMKSYIGFFRCYVKFGRLIFEICKVSFKPINLDGGLPNCLACDVILTPHKKVNKIDRFGKKLNMF